MLTNFHVLSPAIKVRPDSGARSAAFLPLRTRSAGARAESRGRRYRFYRAMHYSAKRSLAIAYRPSVCPLVRNVGGSGPHRWEILETNYTAN